MKLGIIAPSHDRNGVKFVADLGLKYAEFDINAPDYGYVEFDEVASALEEFGVKMGAIGRWGTERILESGEVNEDEFKKECFLVDFCRRVGCPVYMTGINYVESRTRFENLCSAVEYLRRLRDYCGSDVKLCTYNCHWNNYIDKPEEWEIVNKHLGIGIKYDPSHSINGGRDYMREAVEYGGMAYHIHLKGTMNIGDGRIDDPPAGLDMINWGMLLSVFAKHGYDGMLSIEPHSETWQGELGRKGVLYTIDYFRRMPFITE